ncbi:MAG: DUF2797 domain-containing protein [Chitinophagales bacterium]|nr:DUF2797 domain-containing protein [Chitinophagales bacterium]
MIYSLSLRKLQSHLEETSVFYTTTVENEKIDLNRWVGNKITVSFGDIIHCVSCGKKIPKTYGEGFCYPCYISVPESSPCIIHPELCKAHLGEGRDVAWEESHHNQPHIVYLSYTGTLKIGVTRNIQIPYRWIDQGASQAIVVAETPYRKLAGDIEVALKQYVADKTNWRKMLTNFSEENLDLQQAKTNLLQYLSAALAQYALKNSTIKLLEYPVIEYPQKVQSLKLTKNFHLESTLVGIKGQYLIFEEGNVLNVRSHTGYFVQIRV